MAVPELKTPNAPTALGLNSSVLSVKVFAGQDVRALAVAVETFGDSRRLQACQTRTSDAKDRGDAT